MQIIKINWSMMPENIFFLLAHFERLTEALDTIAKDEQYYRKLYEWFNKVNKELERLIKDIGSVLDVLYNDEDAEAVFLSCYAIKVSQLKENIDSHRNSGSVEDIFLSDKIAALIRQLELEYREIEPRNINGLYQRVFRLNHLDNKTKRKIEKSIENIRSKSTLT